MLKSKVSFLMAILFILGMISGCTPKNDPDGSIRFYYCYSEYQYDDDSGVIAFEHYIPAESATDLQILNDYFRGPSSSEHHTPFPSGTDVVSLEVTQNKAIITASADLSALDGIDLTVACACITLTVQQLTGRSTVEIRSSESLLNNQKSVIMNTDDLLLTDIVTAETEN